MVRKNPLIINIHEFIMQKQYNLPDLILKKKGLQQDVKNDYYLEYYSKWKLSKTKANEYKKNISNTLNSTQLMCLLELELEK